MKAAVFYPQSGFQIEEKPVPEIGPEDLLIKVRACGICGTDVLKVNRNLPKDPVVLGHELVGEIVACGAQVSEFSLGDRVVVAHHVPCEKCHYCRHGNHSMCRHFKSTNLDPGGFAEYLRVPGEHVRHTTFPVPEHLSDEEALFTEPLSCCVRNIRRANLQKGDLVIIVGMGSIGLMTLQLLKLIPTKVLALDLKDERLSLAKELGADRVCLGNDPEIQNLIADESDGRMADLVIFTAGGGKAFQNSFEWVRDGGALNLFASLSDHPIETSLDALYHHEITVFSSYSPSPEDLREAHRLICEREVNLKPLITHHLELTELAKGIETMNRQEALKVIIHP